MSLAYLCDNPPCSKTMSLPFPDYDLDEEITKAGWVTVHSIEIGYKTFCSVACTTEGLKGGEQECPNTTNTAT